MNTKKEQRVTGASGRICRSCVVSLALAVMLSVGVSQAFAREVGGGGGYLGPTPAIVTIEQAKGMRDDSNVVLRGYILRNLGGKDYEFKDDTGTITVEISDKRWLGQTVGPNDLVEIHGEVEKDWMKAHIEAKRIIKQ